MHHAIRQRKFANFRPLRGVEPSLVNGAQNARDAAVIGVEHCGAHAAFALVAVRIVVGEAVEQLSIGENRIEHGGGIPAQGVCGHGGDAVEDFHAAQPAEGAHQLIDTTGYSARDKRVHGFLAERLLDVWLAQQDYRVKELPVAHLERQHWGRKIAAFLLRKMGIKNDRTAR